MTNDPPGAPPVTHGALDHAEIARLGLHPEAVLDFSSNINPFGPPPAARAALAELDPSAYPDRSCHRLRAALAAHHECPIDHILVGSGANEIIHLIARALLHAGDTALVVGPTYGEYAHASLLAGAAVAQVRPPDDDPRLPDAAQILAAVHRSRPRLTWLCAPNNPTGDDPAPALVTALASACAAHGGLLVLDRSYADLRRDGQARATGQGPGALGANLLSVHSLTKSYALAGLRLGYLLAAPAHIARTAAYQPTWSVSSAAQAAGLAALADAVFLPRTIPRLWEESDALLRGLRELVPTVRRGALPLLLVRTGDGAATRAALLARGCAVRDCASFGLPAWVRVAPRRPEENARLLATWKEIV